VGERETLRRRVLGVAAISNRALIRIADRSAGYERYSRQARETAIGEMVAEAGQLGADAVIGVDVDYESIQIGQGGSMLMVSASGTAVKL
jgi:uncharacterized protein YbjQ (UPF0145 family)